jgi:hypothetical protein
MNLDALVLLLEPAAWLGAAATLAAALSIRWHYRGNQQDSLEWHLCNWRMRQALGVSALFYLALAVSCLILHDHWGWLYVMVALRLGGWWYKRLLNEQASFSRSRRSRA